MSEGPPPQILGTGGVLGLQVLPPARRGKVEVPLLCAETLLRLVVAPAVGQVLFVLLILLRLDRPREVRVHALCCVDLSRLVWVRKKQAREQRVSKQCSTK